MKKLFASLISIILITCSAFALSACNETPPPAELSNEELSTAYKQVALSAWDSIGVDDPTATSAPALLYFPDNRVEIDITLPENATAKKNILINANSMAGFMYMLSLLYECDGFETTNGLSKFDATITMGSTQSTQSIIISSSLNKDTGTIFVELIVNSNGSPQYCLVDVNYDFNTNALKSYRFISNTFDPQMGNMVIDMGLTEQGEYKWYQPVDNSDPFIETIRNRENSLNVRAQTVSKLTGDFSDAYQTYFTILQKVMMELL